MAYAYVMTGRRVEAAKLADSNRGNPYAETIIYALGDIDRMFEELEQTAVHQPQRVGRLLVAPELVAFRSDPRFRALRQRLNLP